MVATETETEAVIILTTSHGGTYGVSIGVAPASNMGNHPGLSFSAALVGLLSLLVLAL